MAATRRIAALRPAHVDTLTEWFKQQWWSSSPPRGRADVEVMLKHSIVLAFEDEHSSELAAFGRAISDRAFKALILDVIVAPERRRSGLGQAVVQAALEHEELARVRHIELYCAPDMVPYYERQHWQRLDPELAFMRLDDGAVPWRYQGPRGE